VCVFICLSISGDARIPLKAKNAGRLYYRKDDGEGNVLDAPGKEDQYKMCCSAKIALWNVVGLQGALLAQLLTHPVYLSTIFVKEEDSGEKEGTVCEASLKRAFFGHLQGLQSLPDGYKVNEPTIVVLPSNGGASGGSGSQKHTAFCWAAGFKKEEMIKTTSGLREKETLMCPEVVFQESGRHSFPVVKGNSIERLNKLPMNIREPKGSVRHTFLIISMDPSGSIELEPLIQLSSFRDENNVNLAIKPSSELYNHNLILHM